ncbi:inositol oxygenase [Sporodiniella umbellata]|nr:inositol oxygenase [Sporodiniella umbellata]
MRNISEAVKVTEAWEAFVKQKYGQNNSNKETGDFRDYQLAEKEQPTVAQFYKENHEKQTMKHVMSKKERYESLDHGEMGVWEALELLDTLVDESDPDTQMTQIMHSLQSAEAARRDNQPRWMILTALIHDLGKYLFFLGEPQWTVVGDTFPVGCQFSQEIVYSKYFDNNPDSVNTVYSSQYGIYSPHCGLHNVHMSYGHDEYLYHVVKDYLPAEAAFIIRFHSFYSCHNAGQYSWLLNSSDIEMMKWVKVFNQYDLYSKAEDKPDVEALKPFYLDLINEFFPNKIKW